MKRMYIGIALLLVFLLTGGWISLSFARIYQPMAQKLQQAQQAAEEARWDEAAALARQVQTAWEKSRDFAAMTTDHEPIEQIDALFAELDVWLRQREKIEFALTCSRLACATSALADVHGVRWRNLL